VSKLDLAPEPSGRQLEPGQDIDGDRVGLDNSGCVADEQVGGSRFEELPDTFAQAGDLGTVDAAAEGEIDPIWMTRWPIEAPGRRWLLGRDQGWPPLAGIPERRRFGGAGMWCSRRQPLRPTHRLELIGGPDTRAAA
jgi:hypothetical protein